MENLNLKQLETVTAAKSNRPYVKLMETKAGKLFANLEWEMQLVKVPVNDKPMTLPTACIAVRFASDGGSWGMKERDQGSQLPDGLGNLEKVIMPVCLGGPIAYTQGKLEEKMAIPRLFAWFERIAKANAATMSVDLAYLEELFQSKIAGKIENDPIEFKTPGEPVAPPKAKAAPPIKKADES